MAVQNRGITDRPTAQGGMSDGTAGVGAAAAPAGYTGEAGEAEWAARIELAEAYHTVAKLGQKDWGWTHCVYNHITVKLPGVCSSVLGTPGPLFLINSFGCRFDEVTPESLHTVDLDGTIVRRGEAIPGVKDRGVLLAGFTIHSAVHAAREDVQAIFHVGSPSPHWKYSCALTSLCSSACVHASCSCERTSAGCQCENGAHNGALERRFAGNFSVESAPFSELDWETPKFCRASTFDSLRRSLPLFLSPRAAYTVDVPSC